MTPQGKSCVTAVGFLVGLFAITFWHSFEPGKIIATTDNVFGMLHYVHQTLPRSFLAFWSPLNLVGLGNGQNSFSVTGLLTWLLPPPLFASWIHCLYAFAAGFFFLLFLRQKRFSILAALFGAIVYCYGSPNFSFVHPGHVGKFGVFAWFAATLWTLEGAFNHPRAWSWKIATGAFLGLTVSEQPDLAILFVWLFAAYLAFQYFGHSGLSRGQALYRFGTMLLLSGLVSGLVAANVVVSQYTSQVKGIVQVSEENKSQSWDWATQWSYPPQETLELIAPGFFGWRVDDAVAPYWGNTGRSADYNTTKQGFPRFKLDNSFIGIVPLSLAVAISVFAFRKRFRAGLDPATRKDILFWAVTSVVVLLLAFGKYFLFYYFFYSLPKMNIIRNPAKFMHVFMVGASVLSAYGFHHLVERKTEALNVRSFWKILAALGAAALLIALYIYASNEAIAARFTEEFGKASAGIVAQMSQATLRLAFSCGILAVVCFWLNRSGRASQRHIVLTYMVLLLAIADLYLTNRHFLEYSEYKPQYAENDLVHFLQQDPDPQRVKILSRDPREHWFGFYNNWLTIYFPYHHIECFDIPQIPRMPFDYEQYFAALQNNVRRLWELTNCKYLLGPIDYWPQFQNDPFFKPWVTLAYAYNLALSNNVVVTTPATNNTLSRNTQIVIQNSQVLPRVKLFDRWQTIPDDRRCLSILASREFNPAEQVIVSDSILPQTNTVVHSVPPTVEWVENTDNLDRMRVTADQEVVLLFNEKYDPAFVVRVDGKPAQLLRCNYIMKGVRVEPGKHEVAFEYRPPRVGFYLSIAGWMGCLFGVPALGLWERGREKGAEKSKKQAR